MYRNKNDEKQYESPLMRNVMIGLIILATVLAIWHGRGTILAWFVGI